MSVQHRSTGTRPAARPRGLRGSPLRWAMAAAVVLAAAALSRPALSGVIESWDPNSIGMGGMFGTVASAPPETNSDFIPAPGFGLFATYNGQPTSSASYLSPGDFATGTGQANATVGAFSVGAATSNQRGLGNVSLYGPMAAGGAAATEFYIPASPTCLPPNCLIPMNLKVTGSFPQNDTGGNFVYFDIHVNRLPVATVEVIDFSNANTAVSTYSPSTGAFLGQTFVGPWSGSLDVPFELLAATDTDTFGRIDVRLWGESGARGTIGSAGNALDFLGTATLTADPGPGQFLGLATGLAFVPDAAVAVPEPASGGIFLLGLAAMALVRRRPRA